MGKKTKSVRKPDSVKNGIVLGLPYPVNVHYFIDKDPDKILKCIGEMYSVDIDEYIENSSIGVTLHISHKEEGDVILIIIIDNNAGDLDMINTIHHESIHAAWMILNICNVEIVQENHEALTYLSCYFASEIVKRTLKQFVE